MVYRRKLRIRRIIRITRLTGPDRFEATVDYRGYSGVGASRFLALAVAKAAFQAIRLSRQSRRSPP